ncbi:MAG: 4-hydroxy-3-methylbut-2-enyl diphosphate reductase, partial [Lachnospiraceae bacterium]|nr:4-hydroxy-3-methylbut-2-enyl diphosphate reductase [Lachnospiraceae bacterium]
MEKILARSAGFCFGVKRAVNGVEECIATGKKVYTFGPIIHNADVIAEFEKKGVVCIDDISVLKEMPKGIVIVRSHGVSQRVMEELEATGHEIYDATCPFV